MRLVCTVGFVGACVLAASGAAANVTAFNNFGPGNGGFDYNWGIGWTIAGPNNGSGQFGVEQAISFTAGAGGTLSDIWVPIWRVPFSSAADEVTIRIAMDTGSGAPSMGDVLEEWTITEFESWSSWSPPHQLVSTGGVELEEGASYWIWMEGGDTTWCGWAMVNDPADTLPHTLRRAGEDWLPVAMETAGGLRVDVVPSPAGIAVVLGGLALLPHRRRR